MAGSYQLRACGYGCPLGVLFVGFVLWLSYGIAIGHAPLIVSNIVALTTN